MRETSSGRAHGDGRDGAVSDESASEVALDVLRRRLSRSDRAAFERVFRRLAPRVFRYVRGMVPSDALAHDITQDTFAKLWAVRERMASVDALASYVFQMARRRVYNACRDERVRRANEALLEREDLGAPALSPDDELDAEMLRDLLDRWIADLPARQREALTLRRIDGLSHEAIADIMDISPNTVNNHIVRAMETLRDRLRAHRPDLLT